MTSSEPTQNFKPQRSAVVTGRSEKISDVINVFNTPQAVEEKSAPVSSVSARQLGKNFKVFVIFRNNK